MSFLKVCNRQSLNPGSRARALAALIATALAAAVAFSHADSEHAEHPPVYQWTGGGEDSLWANVANWQVRCAAGQWHEVEAPPPAGSHVIFGDATEADEPQLVELAYHVEIGRLIHAASGKKRSYTVRTRVDPDDTGIDSDSGMLYSITLSEPLAIVQEPSASQPLNLQVDLFLSSSEDPVVELNSRHAAQLRVERGIIPAVADITIIEGRDGATGSFERVRPQLMFGR